MWSDRRKRIAGRCAKVGLVLLAMGAVASWIVGGELIAPRPCVVGDPPPDLPAEAISLASKSGATIAGWSIPAADSKGVVVLVHGIRGSRLSMLERARLFYGAGYSIVMIDLQGHGESSGEQITIGYCERHDVRAAVDFAHHHFAGEPVAVVGVSLGGASALLASPLDIDALVLESVYSDIVDAVHNRVAAQLGFFEALPAEILLMQLKPRLGISSSQLRPIDKLPDVGCPVFLISGTDDRYTTAEETREMYAVARPPKGLWMVDGAAHEDLYGVAPTEYKDNVLRFLGEHMRGRLPDNQSPKRGGG